MNLPQIAREKWAMYVRASNAGNRRFANLYLDDWFEVCEQILQSLPSVVKGR